MNIFIISQILGLIAFILLALSFQMKKKKHIVSIQIIESFFYAIHYLMLGATNGAITNSLGLVRNILTIKFENNKKATKIFCNIFLLIIILITIIIYNGLTELLPLVALGLYSYLMISQNERTLKFTMPLISIIWISYNYLVGSYIGIITESIFIVSVLIGIIRMNITNLEKKT